jgi:hypothetical protein
MFIFGWLNFMAFCYIGLRIGGEALHGKVEDGHYYLATGYISRGIHPRLDAPHNYVEVSSRVFHCSQIHGYSVLVTFPLGLMACALALIYRRRAHFQTVVNPSLAPPLGRSSDEPPIEKKDPSFSARYMVPLVGISSVGLSLAFAFGLAVMPKWWGIFLCCTVIVATIAGIVVMHKIVVGRYRCPNCGGSLPRCDERQRREYLFHCKDCNVRWTTGVGTW